MATPEGCGTSSELMNMVDRAQIKDSPFHHSFQIINTFNLEWGNCGTWTMIMHVTKQVCIVLYYLIGLLNSSALAVSLSPSSKTNWFNPSLTVNKDKICLLVHQAAEEWFVGTAPNSMALSKIEKKSKGLWRVQTWDHLETTHQSNLITRPTSDPRQLIVTNQDGTTTFLYWKINPGCGGACETLNVVATSNSYSESRDVHAVATPPSSGWALYENSNGAHYVMGVAGDYIETYQVSPKLPLICRVKIAPDRASLETDAELEEPLKSLDALFDATTAMSLSGGEYCGSSNAGPRSEQNIKNGLWQALYRPWAVNRHPYFSENSFGDYSRNIQNLELWSLGGEMEKSAFNHYKDQFIHTKHKLSKFYKRKFGWPEKKSDSLAQAALKQSIAYGFAFYRYEPFGSDDEIELRKALMSHRAISDIKAISIDFNKKKQVGDSILNLALGNQEALSYLLGEGVDPNQPNAFGKTPLMYAAQYNQIGAAKLLLEAGADVNVRTTKPPQVCGYNLHTTGMSALHYATRYASSDFIRLLVEHGADIHARSHYAEYYGSKPRNETPLDWLRKYTSGKPDTEVNPNIKASDIPLLEHLLGG